MNRLLSAATLSAIVLVSGCSRGSSDASKAEILAADRAFSARSARDGAKAAFLATIATDAKLLGSARPGAAGVEDELGGIPSSVSLTWEPSFADVSASGDLGYTWGRYRLVIPAGPLGKPERVRAGTYVTLWRRQPDGAWKIVLDGGTPDP